MRPQISVLNQLIAVFFHRLLTAAFPVAALLLAATTSLDGQSAPVASKVSVATNYGKLPLSFEANQGQTDPQVRFLSRGSGYSLFLTDSSAVLALRKPAGTKAKVGAPPAVGYLAGKIPEAFKTNVVRMELAGASHGLRVQGTNQLPGTANYFIGNDPAKWHRGVPTYGKVRYEGVYPGVDLVYYGSHGQLEYDFIVAPNADPQPIRLHFAGAKKLKLDSNGDLEVIAKNGEVAFHKPVVYQETDGKRQAVEGSFALVAKNTVSFALGSYDRSRGVVIDPTLAYSTYLGGSEGAAGGGIAVDASGSAYVTGITASSDFPVTPGAFQKVDNANINSTQYGGNAFVTKLNPTGSALVYSTYLGGDPTNGNDGSSSIAVDASGDAYVTGVAYSTDFPVTSGAFQMVNNGAAKGVTNAFVTKLNSDGSSLIYSTYLGGSGGSQGYAGDFANGIAVDSSGNAYITGDAYSTNFPVTSGAFQKVNNGAHNEVQNGFVTKLNAAGSALVYSTYLGGSGDVVDGGANGGDYPGGIAVDTSGNAYLGGYTYSSDFPVTPGAFQTTNTGTASGASNTFVTKLNPSGTALAYSTFLTASQGYGIAVDASGSAYVTGVAGPGLPVTSGAFQPTIDSGTANAFVTKFDPTGATLVYSTYLGGSGGVNRNYGTTGADWAYGIAVDSSGDAYLTGYAFSTNFPVTPDAFQKVNNGAANEVTNAFVSELNPTGTALVYSSYLGGSGILNSLPFWVGDAGQGIAVDGSGGVYLTGSASSTNFPVTTGAFQTTNGGAANTDGAAFVAKFSLGGSGTEEATATPTFSPAAGTYASAQTVTITDATAGATIYYTTNGTTPTTSSTQYTGSIDVSSSETIEAIAAASAYTQSSVASATFTILGPAASVAALSGSSQTAAYGSSFASPLVVIVKDANGNLLSGVSVSFSGTGLSFSSSSATTGSNGEASVMAAATAAGSLTATASTTGVTGTATFSLTATQVPLTVTANNASVAYDQPIPTLTYTVTGFVNGDTASAVSGTPSETTTATKGSSVGTYPIAITQGTLASTNYSFSTFTPGTLTITSLGMVATPAFSSAAGTYTSIQTVTITDATTGATIYYTTNGTTPTTSSTAYSGAITVNASETIEAIATAPSYSTSAVATAAYIINLPATATPTFSPVAGAYTSSQSVTISDATTSATIYYTTDGTAPTTSSTKYTGAISVASSETIKAIATASGDTESTLATAAYTINIPPPTAATPTLSPIAGTYTSVQAVTITDATAGAAIYYTLDGSTPSATSSMYSSPISVGSTETINAIAVASGYANSAIATAAYTINLPPASFTLAASPSSVSVASGQSASVTLTVTPENGFTSPIAFTCSGLPTGAACSFSPATITPAGSPATSTLTITTTASAAVHPFKLWSQAGGGIFVALMLWPFAKRRRLAAIACLVFLLLAGGAMLGCGGGSSASNMTSTTYPVAVTATGGEATETASITLTVTN